MTKKRICISFDYEHDKQYRYLLSALSKNERSDLVFEDLTPDEVQSSEIGRIKAAITPKIDAATHLLVIVGEHANSYHPDREKIGTRNWQWWEIEKAIELGKKLVAVKIENSNSPPEPLRGQGATWAKAFKVDSIIRAIDGA